MKKMKCLTYRVFPDDMPGNFVVSLKSYLSLIFWLPLGGSLAIQNGLSILKDDTLDEPELTKLEVFLTRLSVVLFGPFVLLEIVWGALKEAIKGRLMSAGIEDFEP